MTADARSGRLRNREHTSMDDFILAGTGWPERFRGSGPFVELRSTPPAEAGATWWPSGCGC
jgi:hypothetical protein